MTHALVKWAGSKRSIVTQIIDKFPKHFNAYYEPFIGSCNVFLEAQRQGILKDKQVVLADIVEPLIVCYKMVRDYTDDVIQKSSSSEYSPLSTIVEQRDKYKVHKDRFNELKFISPRSQEEEVELAVLFLWLNHIGFNGMYRESSKGIFNIPVGYTIKKGKKMPVEGDIINTDNLRLFADAIKNVEIYCSDFRAVLDKPNVGDFVYLDPPYYETFTGYHQSGFKECDQLELVKLCKSLDSRGIKWGVSNSDTPWIKNQFRDYHVHTIQTKRLINSKASERKNVVTELYICNYLE